MKNFIVVANAGDEETWAYGGFHDLEEAEQFAERMDKIYDGIDYEVIEVTPKEWADLELEAGENASQ